MYSRRQYSTEEQIAFVRQLKDRESICQIKEFNDLPIPGLPVDALEDLFQVTLDRIEKSAEIRVVEHLKQHNAPNIEDWLDAGTEIVDKDAEHCPFCGQRLKAGHLLEHYRSYFDKEYKNLKARLASFSADYLQYDEQLASLNRKIQKNSDFLVTWRQELPSLKLNSLRYEEIAACLNSATSRIIKDAASKSQAPLDKICLAQPTIEAIEKWEQCAVKMEEYNRMVIKANNEIHCLKQKLQVSNLEEEERKEQLLRNTQCRHDNPHVDGLCRNHITETSEVESEKRQIKETRIAKDQAIANLFESNKDTINQYLGPEYFNVEFSLCQFDVTRDKAGERVNAYAIKFPTGIIRVGKSDAIPAESSFKNALSAGDRSTLSFAVFLAHLESTVDLSSKVIVIDDPITSMDANRRRATYEAICEVCDRAAQVLVLSHSAEFLHTVWHEYGQRYGRAQSTRRLWIKPKEGAVHTSKIEPDWDSEAFLMNRHRKRIKKVEEFVNGNRHDLDEVGKCLRQIIEHHYKDLYPTQYTSKLGSFGAFLECVAKAQSGDTLKALKDSKLDELRKANKFLRGLHHDDDAPFPNETELRSQCQKVLAHIRSE